MEETIILGGMTIGNTYIRFSTMEELENFNRFYGFRRMLEKRRREKDKKEGKDHEEHPRILNNLRMAPTTSCIIPSMEDHP